MYQKTITTVFTDWWTIIFPNAVILKNLEIIDNENVLELEILLSGEVKKKVSIESAKWGMWNNWSWYKTNVPTVQ